MPLSDLFLHHQYRSDRHHLLQDFYLPCLSQAVQYDRAVGFFRSSSLVAIAQGLASLIQFGGKMRLVASPELTEEDMAAIHQGLRQQSDVIADVVTRELVQEFEQVARDRMACLAWLLSQRILEIRLAVPRFLAPGIYHEKLGIFRDAAGHVVAFSGSANESETAFANNFECIDVFRSWEPGDTDRTIEKVENFDRLWHNQTPGLEVVEFPEAARREWLKRCPDRPPWVEPIVQEARQQYLQQVGRSPRNPLPLADQTSTRPEGWDKPLPIEQEKSQPVLTITEFTSNGGRPRLPDGLVLRSYQQQAIANWFANNGRGTLKMATGSGKTITALAIATELIAEIQLQALLIVCPYRHLVSQWARECQKFGLNPILAMESARLWQSSLATQLYAVRSGHQSFLTVITTNATLISPSFQSQLAYLPEKTLIIGDEAHNLGSPQLEKRLPRTIGLRLALSATPERYFDDDGTQRLLNYFGEVLQPEFTLADALQAGALVRYTYYPLLVELTESEAKRYSELTAKIARALSAADEDPSDPTVAALSMLRAKLISNAANKLDVLRSLMQPRLHTSHTLFYCGDGSVEQAVSMDSDRQVDAVVKLLGAELGYRVATYTAETPLVERDALQQQFADGDLQGLVAIRCLDEGVDIPATQTAVMLASSSNPRQFIQRRGRVLRPHPSKKRATLFDMIVLPPVLGHKTFQVERNLLRKELRRFLEFADLADNAAEARMKLLSLQSQYGLLDL